MNARDASLAEVIDVFLRPGDYAVGGVRHRLRTVLGSCVSITLWHAGLRIGAMSHFLLASRRRAPAGEGEGHDGRYGEEVVPLMIAALSGHGVPVEQCVAKLFGGGDMFPGPSRAAGLVPVGRQNGEAARRLLAAHGLEVASESLFGVGHRQLIFQVATGDVWVRQVAPEAVTVPAALPLPAAAPTHRRTPQ